MTRLAGLGRGPAIGLALLLLLLIGYGASLAPSKAIAAQGPERGDAALYRAIDTRVAAGELYYGAAAAEHRARHYPLQPFVTVRLPTLAWISAALGAMATLALLRALVLVTLIATVLRLRVGAASKGVWAVACAAAAACAVPLAQPALAVWHEIWAGLLVTLALACRSEERWWPSVLIGLLAVLFREIALPFLVAMAAVAAFERRRTEALAWSGAVALFALLYAGHAAAVHAVVLPGDAASPGWSRFGGWRFVLAVMRDCSVMQLLPEAWAALLVPLALLGWAAWPGGHAARYAATLALWSAALLVIGRPGNFYWGLLMAPLLPLGLVFAVPALRDLATALFGARVAPPQAFAGPA